MSTNEIRADYFHLAGVAKPNSDLECPLTNRKTTTCAKRSLKSTLALFLRTKLLTHPNAVSLYGHSLANITPSTPPAILACSLSGND